MVLFDPEQDFVDSRGILATTGSAGLRRDGKLHLSVTDPKWDAVILHLSW
jgi:hypothetical protein